MILESDLDDIKIFMEMKFILLYHFILELSDPNKLCFLAFPIDIVLHLNSLNVKLQCRNHLITMQLGHVKAFKVCRPYS